MSRIMRWIGQSLLAVGLGLSLAACGGGSSGGGGGPGGPGPGGGAGPFDPAKDFFLKSVFIARPIFDVAGEFERLVHPASLHEVDPITGVALDGFPKPLVSGTNVNTLLALNLVQILDPLTPQTPLVPRNAALVLEFSKPVLASSVGLSDADPEQQGLITGASSIQIRLADGSLVPAQALVDGARVILLPFVDDALGWAPSPLFFDKFGNPVQDPEGYMRLRVDAGAAPLASTLGLLLKPRPDKLGTVEVPLPFNPGNSLLDAIVKQTDSGTIGFNGFLPDLSAPRIIRAVIATGVLTNVSAGPPIELAGSAQPQAVNVVANGGAGEWANALIEIPGPNGTSIKYVVESNSAVPGQPTQPVFRLAGDSTLQPEVIAGATFTVTRSEFFEPIAPPLPADPLLLAKVTVDPVNHPRDPLDPQDLVNHDLRYFVRMFDENGSELVDRWNPATGTFLPVPPKAELRLLFSEPMDVSSFRPYESFAVTELAVPKQATGFGRQRIGRAEAGTGGREIAFVPFLDNQLDPSLAARIGFGGTPSSLKLVLRSRPEQEQIAAIKANASPTQLAQLGNLDVLGVSGITDLGGRGLALPAALLDSSDGKNFLLATTSSGRGPFPPALDFQVPFQTQASADPDIRAIVHRFMGQATTASFVPPPGVASDSVTTGVEFTDYPAIDSNQAGVADRKFIYGPNEFDIGLNIPGWLTGASAVSIEHLIDDFNKPSNSPWASPIGQDVLAKVGFGTSTPLNSVWGSRFQHVLRAGDASPAFNTYRGIVLDLVGLAWSPLNNVVTQGSIQDFELLVGLSGINSGLGPNTNENSGIPVQVQSGLGQQFDCNLLEWTENCCSLTGFSSDLLAALPEAPPQTSVVRRGTQYAMSAANLFRPANAVGLPLGTFNFYLGYPSFNAGFDPYFNDPNVFSFPYDSRFPMLIEIRTRPSPDSPPPTTNFYRFSPGILTSALPRFRVWSQGQHPLAWGVPNWSNGVPAGCNDFRSGEGGPLLAPDDPQRPVSPPASNNGMPQILGPYPYVLPPNSVSPPCVSAQPTPDSAAGNANANPPTLPKSNTNPDSNWYFGNGMFTYPLPNMTCFPGPTGQPPTQFYGFGGAGFPSTSIVCGATSNEPNYLCKFTGAAQLATTYGDNTRYYTLFKYVKRTSQIQSPTIQTESETIEYLRPLIYPPLEEVPAGAGLRVEVRAGSSITFSIPVLDSGYVDITDPDFEQKVTGFDSDRQWVKFRASFGIAQGQQQPPAIDTIIIPYRKVAP